MNPNHIFDYYASLHKNEISDKALSFVSDMNRLKSELVNSSNKDKKQKIRTEIDNKKKDIGIFLNDALIEKTTVWVYREDDKRIEDVKEQFRIKSRLEDLKLPDELKLDPDFSQLPDPSWFGIEVKFELTSPWYSKDDRPFHVLDNPVRKDRVFGVPFMSAASWKGMLRWACRMQAGLCEHLESHHMKMDGWKDPAWIVHLFGNERAEGEEFSRGALVLYPTWFDKVDFEVINPHRRKTRAGTQPIYYEVVPAGTKGRLRLLYAPLPGEIKNGKINPAEIIANLIDSIKALFETYGISAKRTAGWGTARIDMWTGFVKDSDQPAKAESRSTKRVFHSLQELGSLVSDQKPPGSFTSKKAEGFKAEMKNRIARKGGGL